MSIDFSKKVKYDETFTVVSNHKINNLIITSTIAYDTKNSTLIYHHGTKIQAKKWKNLTSNFDKEVTLAATESIPYAFCYHQSLRIIGIVLKNGSLCIYQCDKKIQKISKKKSLKIDFEIEPSTFQFFNHGKSILFIKKKTNNIVMINIDTSKPKIQQEFEMKN